MDAVLFSSAASDWETPDDLFSYWNRIFQFTVDVCASADNTKCKDYFDITMNGLAQDWSVHTCWMNPPYGREVGKWMKKAYEESQLGALACCLVASRTDTRWWHQYVTKADLVKFLPGRLKFKGARDAAPFPSAVVVFLPGAGK